MITQSKLEEMYGMVGVGSMVMETEGFREVREGRRASERGRLGVVVGWVGVRKKLLPRSESLQG